ncbi:MAG: type II secretion system protein, partial [Opitutus sp.]
MRRAIFRVLPGDNPRPDDSGHGFTLLELLMVVAVIAILAGTVGLALGGRGGGGGSLSTAQNIVAGLVGTTRAEAALHQTNARLIVHAQPPPTGSAARYLRVLQVVREEPFGSDAYVAVGDPVALPEPVCIVPVAAVPADHLGQGVIWPTHPLPVSALLEQ